MTKKQSELEVQKNLGEWLEAARMNPTPDANLTSWKLRSMQDELDYLRNCVKFLTPVLETLMGTVTDILQTSGKPDNSVLINSHTKWLQDNLELAMDALSYVYDRGLGGPWRRRDINSACEGDGEDGGAACREGEAVRQLLELQRSLKIAAQVGTDTSTVYAIAPEMLMHIFDEGTWKNSWFEGDYETADKLIRQHGGAVFHPLGVSEVLMPNTPGEGYLYPYHTEDFKTEFFTKSRVAARWVSRTASGTEPIVEAFKRLVPWLQKAYPSVEFTFKATDLFGYALTTSLNEYPRFLYLTREDDGWRFSLDYAERITFPLGAAVTAAKLKSILVRWLSKHPELVTKHLEKTTQPITGVRSAEAAYDGGGTVMVKVTLILATAEHLDEKLVKQWLQENWNQIRSKMSRINQPKKPSYSDELERQMEYEDDPGAFDDNDDVHDDGMSRLDPQHMSFNDVKWDSFNQWAGGKQLEALGYATKGGSRFAAQTEDDPDFVSFGNVARRQIGEQAQYASRYVGGRHGSPDLGKGLRFKGDPRDYHFLLIHKDDVEEFVRRVLEYLKASGQR